MLRREPGAVNSDLELLLYCNRLQLATSDAMYSDGDKYSPAVEAIRGLKEFLPAMKEVLVLGSGLGSMVTVILSKGCSPRFTLVEYDKVVLRWALEFLEGSNARTEAVCTDAALYMARNTARYDLIFIDIFNGRVVPDFVTGEAFLSQCRDSLTAGGHIAFNYMVNDKSEWEQTLAKVAVVFPSYKVIKNGVNRIIIAPAGK